MAERVQVILEPHEKDLLLQQARRDKSSLSGWIRAAALRRAEELTRTRPFDADSLNAFFAACDAREAGDEPGWDDHLQVIQRSRSQGSSET